mgnify:CR=1 FL=1
MKRLKKWRHKAYHHLDMSAWHRAGISPINRLVIVLILTAVSVAGEGITTADDPR